MKTFIQGLVVFLAMAAFRTSGSVAQGWALQQSGTTQNLYGVAFVDPDNGIVVGQGGTILRTVDGGATWTSQDGMTTDSLWGVSFVDGAATAVGGATILRSTDGGETWTRQDSGLRYTILRAVSFVDRDTGWVGSDAGILHTTDGGETWALQDTAYSQGISFVDAKTGWTVGYGVRRTTDGGETWSTRQLVPGNGIFFIDAITGFTAYGGCGAEHPCRGGISRTIDGGESWTMLEFGGAFNAVSFGDPKTGTVVGGFRFAGPPAIFRTTDGGETWSPQYGLGYRLYAVTFLDANIGTAVGGSGTILHTTTGGE